MELELRSVGKVFHDGSRTIEVLSNVSYTFRSGERYAIIGRSGVGKSTLLQLIGGLDTPDRGSVVGNGVCISSMTEDERAAFRREHLAFLFQFQQLLPEFSAEENVAMPLRLRGQSREAALDEARRALAVVGVADRSSHLPSMLSGGEQQRVALARASVTNPTLLLADEPTGSLDPVTAAAVAPLLLASMPGRTVVVVTHDQEFAALFDHVLEMHPGGNLIAACVGR